jgi:hypothetical protein
MSYFHNYIYLIIFVKLLFVVLATSHFYLKSKGEADSDLNKKIVYWEHRVEFIFEILMAFLLIYLFNPRHDHKVLIDKHVKVLLYLFGFIILITAKWSNFFEEYTWFKDLQKIIGKQD